MLDVEKTRIVSIPGQIKSFAAVFLDDPHRAGRYFATLRKIHEDKLFQSDGRSEPYYTAAYAAYRLEYLFRNNLLPVQYKPVRWHVLMAMRIMIAQTLSVPPMNSAKIAKLCAEINKKMWDADLALKVFEDATSVVNLAFSESGRQLDRDVARSQDSTEVVIGALRAKIFGPTSSTTAPDTSP